jgi:hypothetical protein
MKERRYYSASRLTTILSVLAAAIGISVSLFTDITPKAKVGIVFFVSLSIVVIMLVARLSRESLYRNLEHRISREISDDVEITEITQSDLEQRIHSESREAGSLRKVNPKELDQFTEELAGDLRSRQKPPE